MKEFRYRPKDQYINEADWQQIYVLTKHWLSDLNFYGEDLNFLRHVVGKYFMWLAKAEDTDLVREIEVSLIEMHHECEDLVKRVQKHLHHLAELIDDPFKYDSHTFRAEHEILENEMVVFVKKVRNQRKETFSVTNYLIEEEKLWDKEEV